MVLSVKNKKEVKTSIYTEEELLETGKHIIPNHIAIIMDGNRRWAINHRLPIQFGYAKGADRLKKIVEASMEIGVKVLTVYAFSTENWKRSKSEVNELLLLFRKYLINERKEMKNSGICLETIGDVDCFPTDILNVLKTTKEMTKGGKKFSLVLAVNYGARDEIKRAVAQIAKDFSQNKLSEKDLTEDCITNYLDTAKWRDPDLLIRTSGEFRLSNFLLWQLSYTEIYISDILWPDFDHKDLLAAINSYQKREIRRGI